MTALKIALIPSDAFNSSNALDMVYTLAFSPNADTACFLLHTVSSLVSLRCFPTNFHFFPIPSQLVRTEFCLLARLQKFLYSRPMCASCLQLEIVGGLNEE